MLLRNIICTIILFCISIYCQQYENNPTNYKPKTVLVSILARNKQHVLPYFLTLFSQLNYPKDRISLFIRSEDNVDNTSLVIRTWLKSYQHLYHSVDSVLNETHIKQFSASFSEDRFHHIISLKEQAFKKARQMWADYVWFLDADVFLSEPNLLLNLISKNKSIVAPMLKSIGKYSNYWCGMTEQYWYVRTDDYLPILERKRKGCFKVPLVLACVLVDLSYSSSDYLTHDPNKLSNYNGPYDDIIAFAVGSKVLELDMYVCNDMIYGYVPPTLDPNDELSVDYRNLIEIKLQAFVDFPPVLLPNELKKFVHDLPSKSNLGFDEIYLINLERRKDRLSAMINSFDEMGIEFQLFTAIDGQSLNFSYLDELGVQQLSNYRDPFSKRDMTFGEIGCFLSHYNIWKDIVQNNHDKVLIFEDDIRFEPYFKEKLQMHSQELQKKRFDWDLIYLGRKILDNDNEYYVDGINDLVEISYSHWTLSYMITLEGAKKLLEPRPLTKLVPVDEFLPIMYDKHPKVEWMEKFERRELKAYSFHPRLVHPTHYVGDEGYISDTEHSEVIAAQDAPEEEVENFETPLLGDDSAEFVESWIGNVCTDQCPDRDEL